MELNELKNAWTSVDERLKKQEILNTRMVQEMLRNKSSNSLNKLINLEIFSLVTSLLVIPLMVWLLTFRFYENFIFPKITLIVIIAACIVGIILGCYSLINYFMRIDFSKNIKNNMHYVNRYNIFYRKSKMANYFVIIPILSSLGILVYYELKVPFYLWVFLFVSLTTAIGFTIWAYKKVYDKNIQTIKKSLEELKELEELEE